MRIVVDKRWIGPHGIGRFAREIIARLPSVASLPLSLTPLHPLNPIIVSAWLFRNRPDVYFTPGFNPPIVSSVPYVFTLHDLIHLHFRSERSLSKDLYYEYVIKPATHKAYRIVTVSHFSKRQIVNWAKVPEDRVIVISNGVGSEFSPQGERYEPSYSYFLCFASGKPHKNIGRILEGFALSGLAGEFKLVCVGRLSRKQQKWISEHSLESHVEQAGILPNSALPGYYRGALALVFPSLFEGFGLPALEAMASGTPVITSKVTSLPEVVGDAAWYVDPMSSESIAEGMRRLAEDSRIRDRLRRAGLERAKLFSWDKSALRIREVLIEAARYE